MEKIIFKDLKKYYYIENGRLLMNDIDYHFNVDLSNIPLLDDAEVLYHHRYTKDGELYPVYYEHYCVAITKKTSYFFQF